MIYLDSAAMSPVLPCAREAYLNAPFGNPSSEHAIGQAARDALEQAREKIASLLDCEPEELFFVSTATEAAAMAIRSIDKAGYDIIASLVEHHAIYENAQGYSRTGLIAYAKMHGQNETGEIMPPPELGEQDLWICDATASAGHVPISFKGLGCDYFLADGIKFGSVPGAAILVAKKGVPLFPLIRGGGQEYGMRSGTENVPAICAMAAALEWQIEHMEENTQTIGALRSMMFYQLSEIPNHKWNTPMGKPCLPHILNISFDGVDAHALSLLLSQEGVMVSPGAACSNGLHEPSHVIMAMYGDEARARSAMRISFSRENTPDEIAKAGRKIKDAVEYLRSLN